MRVVLSIISFCSLAACAPSLHVEMDGSDDANTDVGPFDDSTKFRELDPDHWVLFFFDWADSFDVEGSHHWSKRSFSLNLHEPLAPGTYTVEDGAISVFFGFNPEPKTEDFFDWEAVEGTLEIDTVDEDAQRAAIRLEGCTLEATGVDAIGTLHVSADGDVAIERDN